MDGSSLAAVKRTGRASRSAVRWLTRRLCSPYRFASQYEGDEVQIPYPPNPAGQGKEVDQTASGKVEGRAFVHGKFIDALRRKASSAANCLLVEGAFAFSLASAQNSLRTAVDDRYPFLLQELSRTSSRARTRRASSVLLLLSSLLPHDPTLPLFNLSSPLSPSSPTAASRASDRQIPRRQSHARTSSASSSRTPNCPSRDTETSSWVPPTDLSCSTRSARTRLACWSTSRASYPLSATVRSCATCRRCCHTFPNSCDRACLRLLRRARRAERSG